MINSYIERELQYGAQNYSPMPVVLVKGEGIYLWDDSGKRYMDMMSAYSAVSHGHCHPKLVKVLQEQVKELNVVSRAFYTNRLGQFLERACELTGIDKALPMNSGAEAVETALKAARKWGHIIKGIPNDQAEIIVCQKNFHGRTIAIIGMSSNPQYREGFGPFPAGFKTIPYNDVVALEKAITPHTAAFLVEPIQGEGGINVPSAGYLRACADICKKHNVLLICDEIQTGLGRTGKLLDCHYEGVKPDAVTLGKALGGGMLPVSLFLARKEVMDVFTPGDHGSTFGGNALAAAVGLAALNILVDEKLVERAAELGNYFQAQLKQIRSPVIKEVRGRGLLVGVEINTSYSAHEICHRLLAHGILTRDTHGAVIRFAPPLVITKDQLDEVVDVMRKICEELVRG